MNYRFLISAIILGLGTGFAAPLDTVEPDGPSSRRSAVTLTEIFYNPNLANGSGNLEFVEIHNTAGWQEDLSGWELKGGIDYLIPDGTILPAGGYLVIAANPDDLSDSLGYEGALGPWSGSLSNSGEAFRLENEVGGTIAEVEYNDRAPWPIAAAGLGHSLILARPSYGENDPRAWAASDQPGGSPGLRDPLTPNPLRSICINEFLANSAEPVTDFVELANQSSEPVDIGGCRLGDGANLELGYVFPTPTMIPAGAYLSLTEEELGFSLGSDGERLWLSHPETGIVDAISFGGQDVNVSRNGVLQELATATPGSQNSGPRERPVVINEIMYHPPSRNPDEEYIELHNQSDETVDVGGWQIAGGIDFTIPEGTQITAGSYLVIARSQAVLLSKSYPGLSASNVLGDFSGSLGNDGDEISLRMPVAFTNSEGQPDVAFASVDKVAYRTGGQWPHWSDGGGSSLELRDPRSNNSLAANWADSDESSKAPWTDLSVTMKHDYRMPDDPNPDRNRAVANRVELFLQRAGECLIDDIEILSSSNTNFVTNGGFESGLGSGTFEWTGQGNQKNITLETTGAASGSSCLRLVASDRGDTGANRVRNYLSSNGSSVATLTDNATYTLKAKVRWLRGSRYFHLRSSGNGLELAGVLELPEHPGTPGAANSTAETNSGPAIGMVAHWPVLPASNEDVVVTALIDDPDGIDSASLRFRVDPSTSTSTIAMNDSGTGGDATANDGIWSATLPGKSSDSLVAWKIEVTDAASGSSSSTFPSPDPLLFPVEFQDRECYVRFGETAPSGNIGSYRTWITEATITEWENRERNSNQPLPATFVLGNYRAFYNVHTLYSGSPWHTGSFVSPTEQRADYEVIFHHDDQLLGDEDFVLQRAGGTCQDEFIAFWICRKLGLFAPNRRPVHMYVNGDRKGTIFEDAEQPSGESIRQYQRSADDGTLYKVEDWFEFADNGHSQNYYNANLPPTSTTVNGVSGVKKMARYRWNWRVRAQADPNAYEPLFELVDLMNAPDNDSFIPNLEAQVDLRNWLGTIMAHHIVGNMDSYGYERGKNAYVYKAVNDRWKAYLWDMDFALAEAQASANSNLFDINSNPNARKDGQPEVAKLFGIPATKRICYNVLWEAANGPLSGVANTIIDQRYADFQNNGISADSPNETKDYIASRRSYILSQLPSASFAVTDHDPDSSDPSILEIEGTAPVTALEIAVNGVVWPVTWESNTRWTLHYQMAPGANNLIISGVDRHGDTVATAAEISEDYAGTADWAALRINEWMSDNESTDLDPADESFDDWMEIHNPSDESVSLTGWYLSDNHEIPNKFQIPGGHSIPAGGYLRVWLDDSPLQSSPSHLHANFALSKSGETIVLSAPDLTLIDALDFSAQSEDLASGRYPNGADPIFDLTLPSAAAPNVLTLWQSHSMTSEGFEMEFTTTPGRHYRLHRSSDLDEWIPSGVAIPATGETMILQDPDAVDAPRFFYQIETSP